jgi:sugar phosphate isomerase/epimerase
LDRTVVPLKEPCPGKRMGLLSISSAPLASYLNRKYYDFEATLYVMRMLSSEKVVDGFEFQLLAEWNNDYTPICVDTKYDRKLEWELSHKYDVEEIAQKINDSDLNIISVHANRDIGVCLCSQEKALVDRGRELIENALSLAELVNAQICVFHLWDTWIEDIDYGVIKKLFKASVRGHPTIRSTVENIPTFGEGFSPLLVVKSYDWVTLDTKWAMMYGELDGYRSIKRKITNVHLRGEYKRGRWLFEGSSRAFNEIEQTLRRTWNYSGLVTIEPAAKLGDLQWRDLVKGISLLR